VRTQGIRAGLAAFAVAVSLAASGCGILGNPLASKPEASGSAAASASPSPSAAPVVQPAEGQCHVNYYLEQVSLETDQIVDCAEAHVGETVYVGRFVGVSASGEVPIESSGTDSDAAAAVQSEAYLDCSTHADKYLGHSWIHMLLDLRITLPTETAWNNGDRWYRCDLYQISWDTGDEQERRGSLKTAWFDPVCVDLNKDHVPIIACAKKHPSEFTGGYLAPATKTEPKTDSQYKPYHKKCYSIIGKYLGISTSSVHSTVGDSVQFQYAFEQWRLGRRAVYCFTWTGPKASSYVTGSAKGRKGKGL
jgi:hypothetical protein